MQNAVEPHLQNIHIRFTQRACTDKDYIMIYCNIFINETTADFSTNIRVPKRCFDKRSGTVKKGYELAEQRNIELSTIMRNVMKYFECTKNDKVLTAKSLIKMYRHGIPQSSILDYFKSKLPNHQNSTFKYAYLLFEKFCKQANLETLSIRGFSKSHVAQYKIFLENYQTRRGTLSVNSRKEMLSTLRFILNEAIKGCLIDRNVMLGEIPKPQKTSFVFLESIDLERLKSYEFKKESQRIAADLFVFQCYTGFSYSDLMSFESKQHLIKGTDGKDWIRKRRIKTAVEAHLPLFEEARIILEKYKYELPKMILATYNRLLVRIANELSMSKITSHVARKTACMLFLESGLDFDSIALMVGHSTAETTRNFYAKVRPVRIINQLKDSKLKW